MATHKKNNLIYRGTDTAVEKPTKSSKNVKHGRNSTNKPYGPLNSYGRNSYPYHRNT